MFSGNRLPASAFPKDLNWNHTHLVLVEGSTPCGHMLLYVGGGFGHYFHFNGPKPFDYPHYLNGEAEYRRYLLENKKEEVVRKFVSIGKPQAAEEKLRALMQNQWQTYLLHHNCATFAQEVIKAGGSPWGMFEGCPVFGVFFRKMKENFAQ